MALDETSTGVTKRDQSFVKLGLEPGNAPMDGGGPHTTAGLDGGQRTAVIDALASLVWDGFVWGEPASEFS
jgi:hypothetical protein